MTTRDREEEWSMKKLGWTRDGEGGGVETQGDEIKQAVKLTVRDCQLQLVTAG